MSEAYDDFDTPWKQMLEWYFKEFMAFFFPKAHAQIDWRREVGYLDKVFHRQVAQLPSTVENFIEQQ